MIVMPIYEYQCMECEHEFDSLLPMESRKRPTKEPCPKCNKKTVGQRISKTTMGADMTLTPNKKTGGQWNTLMDKMKSGTPDRYHHGLDKASSRSAGRFGPQ